MGSAAGGGHHRPRELLMCGHQLRDQWHQPQGLALERLGSQAPAGGGRLYPFAPAVLGTCRPRHPAASALRENAHALNLNGENNQ